MLVSSIPSTIKLSEIEEGAELQPSTSDRGFAIGLYLEHLEEAGFLYEQRQDPLDDPELTWLDMEDFEERFEAHIDALVLGGDLALAVCEQQTREGDFGEVHAALCVFCRHRRLDLLQGVLDAMDPDDAERVQAAAAALCHEMPDAWAPDVIRWIDEPGVRRQVAAQVAGYRRLEAGEDLLRVLPACSGGTLRTVVWALGQLQYQPARVPLYEQYLQHEDDEVKAAAAVALLQLNEPEAVHYCLSVAGSQSWALVPLGLGGSASDATRLLSLASTGDPHPNALYALGLLGDPAAVEVLLLWLPDAERAEAAATALNLITGADLYEEVFVPDEVDEDELFEDELEKLQRGEPLTPPGEASLGTTVVRLSQDLERWQAWWVRNRSRFRPGVRYRNGVPYAPACLLQNLVAEASPRRVRQWAYEELVIRYGYKAAPFETEMTVAQQQHVLLQATAWIEAHQRHVQEGKWYFAGNQAFW